MDQPYIRTIETDQIFEIYVPDVNVEPCFEDSVIIDDIPILSTNIGTDEIAFEVVEEETPQDTQDDSKRTSKFDQLSSQFCIDIRAEGRFSKVSRLLVLECADCPTSAPFSSLAEFLCHYVSEHQTLLSFQCYVCSEIVKCSSFADHFAEHNSLNDAPDIEVDSLDDSATAAASDKNVPSLNEFFRKRMENGKTCFECKDCFDVLDVVEHCATHLKENHRSLMRKFQGHKKKKKKKDNNMSERSKQLNVNDKKFVLCPVCGKTFSKVAQLKIHARYHTGDKPYGCEECGKRFARCYCYKQHLLTHSREKLHLCQTCGKSFTHKSSFAKHPCNRVNVEKKSYHCDICDKILGSRDTLIVHMRIHTKEKPFKCDYCSTAFTTKSSKRRHHKVHTGEKPHECDYCEMTFKTKNAKLVHHFTHTGNKPLQCEFCPKTFTTLSFLKKHNLRHIQRPHQCPSCSKCFKHFEFFMKHILGQACALKFSDDIQFVAEEMQPDVENYHD